MRSTASSDGEAGSTMSRRIGILYLGYVGDVESLGRVRRANAGDRNAAKKRGIQNWSKANAAPGAGQQGKNVRCGRKSCVTQDNSHLFVTKLCERRWRGDFCAPRNRCPRDHADVHGTKPCTPDVISAMQNRMVGYAVRPAEPTAIGGRRSRGTTAVCSGRINAGFIMRKL